MKENRHGVPEHHGNQREERGTGRLCRIYVLNPSHRDHRDVSGVVGILVNVQRAVRQHGARLIQPRRFVVLGGLIKKPVGDGQKNYDEQKNTFHVKILLFSIEFVMGTEIAKTDNA